MDHLDTWRGYHRGVTYEIKKWQLLGKDKWAYYIVVDERQLPDEVRAQFMCEKRDTGSSSGRKFYDYYTSKDIINDLDWHNGLTFYDKEGGLDEDPIRIKLGCDYSHFWDEGKQYSAIVLENDARHTIDKLWELVPNLKAWCRKCGSFHNATEGVFDDEGYLRVEICGVK